MNTNSNEIRLDVSEVDQVVLIDAVRLSAFCVSAIVDQHVLVRKMVYEVLDMGVVIFVVFDSGYLVCNTAAIENRLFLTILSFGEACPRTIAHAIVKAVGGRVAFFEIADRPAVNREATWW